MWARATRLTTATPARPPANPHDQRDRDAIAQEAAALLQRGQVNVDAPEHAEQRQPSTLLCQAAELGAIAFVDALLAAGAAVDRVDWLERTPLHWAVVYERHECAERLLRAGAPVSDLARFVAKGDVAMLELLLRYGVDVVQRGLHRGMSTRLYMAAQENDAKIVVWLLRHGAAVDAPGFANRTPLFNAARHPSHGCVLACLAAGADPNRGCHSNDAYALAECWHGRTAAVLLALAGADVARSRAANHIKTRLADDLADAELVAQLRAELAAARADMLWWRARPRVLDVLIALAPKELPTSVVVDIVFALWPPFEALPFHWTWNLVERVCRRRQTKKKK